MILLMIIKDLNGGKVVGAFYEKGIKKTNQNKFETEKLIKEKGNKLYVKWK